MFVPLIKLKKKKNDLVFIIYHGKKYLVFELIYLMRGECT
jgi:hypothetical protein